MHTVPAVDAAHLPQLLKAMARCIEHDGRISASEAELMRAVADTLDCPMPPLLSDRQA